MRKHDGIPFTASAVQKADHDKKHDDKQTYEWPPVTHRPSNPSGGQSEVATNVVPIGRLEP
jgi:hypothetical protein